MNDYNWLKIMLVGVLTIGIAILTPVILIVELVQTVVGANKNDKDK